MDDHELRQLRIECVNELKSFVSFFNIGGVDHTHGGFCCGLSHAGKRLTDQKFVWFNGRGVWTYARLHRSGLLAHEPAPPHADAHSDGMQGYLLQVAERAAAFAIEHGRDSSGAWIVELSGDGQRVYAPAEPGYIPTTGYGSAFVAEGLAEYALAKHDAAAFALAVELLRAFVTMMDDPSRRGDVSAAWTAYPGMRGLGHHMIALNLTRQLLLITDAAESDASVAALVEATQRVAPLASELRALSDRMVDCILHKFMHPEFGLVCELLAHDYSRPDDANEDLCYIGHSIETLWMVMAEAERRADEALYARAARLFHRHVEVAFDSVCGGYFRALRLRSHAYFLDGDCKVKWAQDEVLVGCAMILCHKPAPPPYSDGAGEWAPALDGAELQRWAAATIRRLRAYLDAHFKLPAWPGSWKVGGDRFVKPDPDPGTAVSGYNMGCTSLPNRVEHYHHPRMLLSLVASADRALAASTRGLRW